MKSAAIVIPIKTNNQRLPGKNTKDLLGRPLYGYLFQTVKGCEFVDEIYVDSSDEYILEKASSEGFSTIERPETLNYPATSGNDLLSFEMDHIQQEIICQCFVTMPFLSSGTIDKSIELLRQSEATSVLALCEVENRFWLNGQPVNHDYQILRGTQYMTPILQESGFYTFVKEAFLKERSRITSQRVELIVDLLECADIDTESDFIFVESLMKQGLHK